MPMTLYIKRAKSFVQDPTNDRGTKKFLAQPGPTPQPVPFWVAETETFRRGILDESIINLTPPHLMPGYKHPTAEELKEELKEVEVEEKPKEPIKTEEEDPEAQYEQSQPPKAEFGAQPMTPVQGAPKVGGITPGAGKRGK
jgi:hypothetical protein